MSLEKMTNAEWAARQITKHGRDRYPTAHEQFVKLVEEVGELGKEVNRSANHEGDISWVRIIARIKSETADVALALYNLAAKYNFDLDAEIVHKVENDTRDFI